MKKITIFIFIIFLFSGISFALPIEITTGSGKEEGIKDAFGNWLKDGMLVQVIKTFSEKPNPPSKGGLPSGNDKIIGETFVGYNFPFDRDEGKFDDQFLVSSGDKIYVRAFDSKDISKAKYYGDSEIYVVKGQTGEYWNINGNLNIPAFKLNKKLEGL